MGSILGGLGFTIFMVLAVLVLVILLVANRYKIAKADEAIVITGRRGKTTTDAQGREVTDLSGQKVVIGGGVFVVPFVQQAHVMSLRTRRISLRIDRVLSANNIQLNIAGVALIKVGGTDAAVRAAAQRFLGQQDAVENFATETLEGSLRAIIGGMTVEQVIRDRATLAQNVREEAENSLANQGLIIDTLQIQTVNDDNEYINNLSRPESAKALQDAVIAEAHARQNAAEKEAEAAKNVAVYQKDVALKKAEIKAETDQATENADAAGPLARAAQDQRVLAAEEEVAIRKAALTARELESTVNKPAEAARYKVVQEAEAEKAARIAAAEAERAASIANAEGAAQSTKLAAEAELEKRRALAEATRLEGEAEAAAILAKGNAEAEALLKKADAYKEYNNAAVTQMVVDILPQVAASIAQPLSAVEGMTIISNDGASALTRTTTDILSQTVGVVKELTGADITSFIGNLAEGNTKELGASGDSVDNGVDTVDGFTKK